MEEARDDQSAITDIDSATEGVARVASTRHSTVTIASEVTGNMLQENDTDISTSEREAKRRRDDTTEIEEQTKRIAAEAKQAKEINEALQEHRKLTRDYLWNNDALNGFEIYRRATVPRAVDNAEPQIASPSAILSRCATFLLLAMSHQSTDSMSTFPARLWC